MRDIVLVMPTVDRSPRTNYLSTTIANLARSGAFSSDRLAGVWLIDSGGSDGWPERAFLGVDSSDWRAVTVVAHPTVRRGPAENASAALRYGAESGAPWVLYLEDDLDVCDDFVGSVGRWLDDHARPEATIYKLAADHMVMERPSIIRCGSWECAAADTWSTVAMVLRADVATDVADWLAANPIYAHKDGRLGVAYDFELQRWAAARGIAKFICSAPSFVQHLGDESAIRPNDRRLVRFPSWPGRSWVYSSRQQTAGRTA